MVRIFNGEQIYWKGFFHTWSGLSENGKAIVEDLDGLIFVVDAEKIKFINKCHLQPKRDK